jgi:RTX calcium-binding nonapeptide repeat (4 copies)
MRLFKVVSLPFALVVAALALCCVLAPPAGAAQQKCTIVGTPGKDVLHGTPGADVICGRGGNDILVGAGGNDILIGGAGNDKLEGGPGDDMLIGGGGSDTLDGGAGENMLRGGIGENHCRDGVEYGCAIEAKATASAVTPVPPTPATPPGPPSMWIVSGGSCAPGCDTSPPLPVDEQPPVLSRLTVGRSLDLAGGEGQIDIGASAWDSLGEVASVTVNVAGPDGSPWRTLSLTKNEALDWEGFLAVPAGSPLGVYTVESVEVVDTAGNVTTADHAWLGEEFDDDEFSVYEGPDTEPPSLESFSITPTVAASSDGPTEVSLVGHVTDAGSGVKSYWVAVTLPSHEPPWAFTDDRAGHQIAGTQVDGTDETVFELPEWSFPGIYEVSAIELEDFAGNKVELEGPELEALGFPTEFEVTGPGDTTPPEIVDVSMSPTTIPAAGGTVVTYVHVRDDLSGFGEWPDEGFSSVSVSFAWPRFEGILVTTGRAPELVSGNALDGTWKIETTFPATDPAGEYSLQYVGAYDRAENGGPMNQTELEAHGWEFAFTKLT